MRLILNRALVFFLLVGPGCVFAVAQSRSDEPLLTNSAVVKLVKAGFKEKTVIAIIGSRRSNFDLSTDRMIELKRSGISERIILAMLYRQQGADLPDDLWSDEVLNEDEKEGSSRSNRQTNSVNPGNSTDIFGSSGGVKGSSRSRGGGGSVSGDTVTTGSATVRIIRPAAEANVATKLERTPSLTNAAIIDLVEAGFSEGTIIRRIEQSPVEFDLSPGQLSELRKRRVSDKILAAMKVAVGNDPATTKNPTGSNVTPKY